MEYPYQYQAYEMQHQPKSHHDEAPDNIVRNTYNQSVEGISMFVIIFNHTTFFSVTT